MHYIKQKVEVEVEVTPATLADIFCDMSDSEQAKFFNAIAENLKSWTVPFAFQLSALGIHGGLTEEGRAVMYAIGEYSQHGVDE